MATAIARGTPNFALPATQNTAPVHEFRCLYTHDLRKKVKKWHDGSARFHTFNRRVMVYDDAKNYIGDLHYRADEEFGEGVELRLDRGVLVEVGERVGETQTDLTGIINRHHTDNDHNPSNLATPAQSRPVQRINATSSQARPKSLTELLGASQGRLGRARLPVQSPFEQRQSLVVLEHEEHPSKRQRVAPGKENGHLLGSGPRPAQTTTKPPLAQHGTPASRKFNAQLQARQVTSPALVHPNVEEGIVSISSDEEVPVQCKRPANSLQTTNKSNSARQPLSQQQSTAKAASASRPRHDGVPSTRPAAQSQAQGTSTRSSLDSAAAPVVTNASAGSSLRPSMSSLKMKPQESRRKLMYRALLPSSTTADQAKIRQPEKSNSNSVSLTQRQATESASNTVELDDLFTFEESQDIDISVAPHPLEEIQQTPAKVVQKEQENSPLFVSQSLSQRSSPVPDPYVHDDFGIPATQVLAGQSDLLPIRSQNTDEDVEMDMNDIPEPESPAFPLPPSRLKAAIQIEMNSSSPPVQEAASTVDEAIPTVSLQQNSLPAETASAAKSLSQHDSPLPHDPRVLPSRPSASGPPLKELPVSKLVNELSTNLTPFLSPLKTPHKSSPKKSPIQRSKSDTSAIIPCAIANPESPPAHVEQGPWTSLEAFLLFDEWPQCKQKNKPVFEKITDRVDEDEDEDTVIDANPTGFAPASKLLQPVGIMSARRVLRDEY